MISSVGYIILLFLLMILGLTQLSTVLIYIKIKHKGESGTIPNSQSVLKLLVDYFCFQLLSVLAESDGLGALSFGTSPADCFMQQ